MQQKNPTFSNKLSHVIRDSTKDSAVPYSRVMSMILQWFVRIPDRSTICSENVLQNWTNFKKK
jgi:hypothetical protein